MAWLVRAFRWQCTRKPRVSIILLHGRVTNLELQEAFLLTFNAVPSLCKVRSVHGFAQAQGKSAEAARDAAMRANNSYIINSKLSI